MPDTRGIEKLVAKEAAFDEIVEAGEEKIASEEEAQQAEASETLKAVFEEGETNPLQGRIDKMLKKTLVEQKPRVKKSEEAAKEKRLAPIDEMKSSAERFSKRNSEFKPQILQLLADKIKNCKTKEDLRKILEQFYSDPTLADDALDFLLEVTRGDLNNLVREAKADHNADHAREIQAGRNIQEEVLKATSQKLGAPTTLRDLYRDITGNPREPVALFLELSDRYAYKDLRKVLAFLFHSLGADLKAQGPSIAAGMLFRLLSEVRSLQAILGVYGFFKARMDLISSLFQRNNLEMPPQLSFEQIAKQFVNLLQERYPTGDKVLQTAARLGIDKWILAKIIIFSQLRDAIREVALHKLYRSVDHRNELYAAIIEALEALEEELESVMEREEEEEEEEEDKERKEKEKRKNKKSSDNEEVS